ncbi:unannotated protein [freshwater metagenome]|uniref:Unannotated protein n=1 Tax=freshwater metagenome TaxID=449393 RepID=A0A6J6QHX2_9ZZZZ
MNLRTHSEPTSVSETPTELETEVAHVPVASFSPPKDGAGALHVSATCPPEAVPARSVGGFGGVPSEVEREIGEYALEPTPLTAAVRKT